MAVDRKAANFYTLHVAKKNATHESKKFGDTPVCSAHDSKKNADKMLFHRLRFCAKRKLLCVFLRFYARFYPFMAVFTRLWPFAPRTNFCSTLAA